MDVCPPGGAKTREEGRPVMTQPPFILLPETKAFWEMAASACCCDGNKADVNLVGVVVVAFVGSELSTVVAGAVSVVDVTSESTLGSSSMGREVINQNRPSEHSTRKEFWTRVSENIPFNTATSTGSFSIGFTSGFGAGGVGRRPKVSDD